MAPQGRPRSLERRKQPRCKRNSLGHDLFSCTTSYRKGLESVSCPSGGLSKTHDLVALLAQCVAHDPNLSALETNCRKLTSYGVAARYPDNLFEPCEEDGRDVVATAYRVREKILLLLP